MRTVTLIAVASLYLASCGPADRKAEGFTPAAVEEPGVQLDDKLEHGTWAMQRVSSRLMTDPSPLSSEQAPQAVTAWYLVDWQRDGTSVRFSERVCAIASAAVFGAQTSFAPAYYAAQGLRTRTAELSDTATGARLQAGPWVDLLGAELADPAADPLPASAADASVRDSDGDGHPGVTVHVAQELLGEGDVYLAQRTVTTLDGVVVAPDRIEGYAPTDSEQVVLEASTWWLEMDTEGAPDPDPGHSYFILQRIDDADGCAEILAARAVLFGWEN